ncbi:MAG TPA: PxKF domain-containing protein [Methylococcaceae bacterium]|nr:PxKF domain-containing protein [Methylococcaceae bacterium]
MKRDTISPVLTGIPASQTIEATSAAGTAITYAAPSADDVMSGVSGAVICIPASGAAFVVGLTTVTCTVQDNAGNSSAASFQVTVIYKFTGFFQPVDNLPTLNSVKAGSSIPVKFNLGGNQGLNIFTAGYPVSQSIACSPGSTNDIEETVAAVSNSLAYDPSTDQYSYVWKTSAAWSGTCRQLVVKLNDGTEYKANFKFR